MSSSQHRILFYFLILFFYFTILYWFCHTLTWIHHRCNLFLNLYREGVKNVTLICFLLPTPVLLPGKSHGRRSLVGCSPWGRKESDMTQQLRFHFTFMHWRRKWQPTPVFLPGESQGRGSLVGCHLWGRTESDRAEATQQQQQQQHRKLYTPLISVSYHAIPCHQDPYLCLTFYPYLQCFWYLLPFLCLVNQHLFIFLKPGRNKWIARHIQPTETKQWINRKSKQTNNEWGDCT